MPDHHYGVGISLPAMTFMLLFDDQGTCVEAAPIAGWCVGKPYHYLRQYWARRKADIVVFPPDEEWYQLWTR